LPDALASIARVTSTEPKLAAAAPADTTNREPEARVDRITLIRPAPRWPHLDVRELWHFRELAGALAWRDVAVRYKQTSIGVAWAILQPFLTMVVFTFVFGRFASLPSNNVPYPIFSYSALLPWTFFASAVALAAGSLVANRGLVTKVYFPRILLPLAGATVPIVDFLLALTVLFGMMVVLVPFFMLMAFVTALGVSLFLSALNARYRDVPYAIPFLLQIWLYLSGVVGAISAFPEKWQWVLAFNPMTTVIVGFQWGFLGTAAPDLAKSLIGVAATATFFVVGLWYFRRSEPKFADTI
jgi:homopolymeric O-antigen transport system permease protein